MSNSTIKNSSAKIINHFQSDPICALEFTAIKVLVKDVEI
jgi:hypothetical protein